jgi:hypothetical protein
MTEVNSAPAPAPAPDVDYEEYKAWKAQQEANAEAAKPAEYYVHLADGQVVQLDESALAEAGSHVNGVQVIASYRVGG